MQSEVEFVFMRSWSSRIGYAHIGPELAEAYRICVTQIVI